MEEQSPTSYCRMIVIGLKYFAVGKFDSSASEHSVNQIQVVVHIVSCFFLEMSLLGGCFDAASFDEGVLCFAALLFLTLSMAKFAMFSLNRKTLHEFIKLIDIEAVTRTNTDIYVKKAIESIAVSLRIYAFVSIPCGLTYTVSAIFLNKLEKADRQYWEIFHLYLPYDVIVFERFGVARLTITGLMFYHGYGELFLDIVTISLFTHVGWQFEAIADMFKNVPYSEDYAESTVRLKEVIEYHQLILRYAEKLQTMYKGVFLVQIASSCVPLCFSLLLCVQTLKSAEGSFLDTISHMSFFGILSLQLFLYTRCADQTKDKALLVSEGVYLSDWHLTTPSTRRDLIWVIMRAQHPINYSAMGMFPMTIATFSQIMRIAYGAFSMLTSLD